MNINEKVVGITTTVPIEAIFAAGFIPADLNNKFITDENPLALIEKAERVGFPRNVCNWDKGLYSACKKSNITKVIGVTQGDCSNTHAVLEIFENEGIEVIDFFYPYKRERGLLELSIKKLINKLNTNLDETRKVKKRLDLIRRKVHEIDEITWRENKVSGEENHLFLVNCSDMKGDINSFEKEIDEFLSEVKVRESEDSPIRLGYIGVPPICPDLYSFVESQGARIVFNETQRQFSMPFETDDIVDQYRKYTYPYDIFFRIEDIKTEIERRELDGLIHYVQSFCFRFIQDKIIRERIDIPILTLECDLPVPLDSQKRTKLQAFIEML